MKAMLERIKQKNQEDGGFTLIELLVVIVIIGVLAGIVVFAVAGITDTGEEAACEADYKAVEVAQEAHFAQSDTDVYAASVAALVTADLLREAPSTEHYAITTDLSGDVSVDGDVGSGNCANA